MTGALILTALLDVASQKRFDDERQRYFPAAINFIPAHVTLFHALPPEERAGIVHWLERVCRDQVPAPFETRGLRFLGRGVAYDLYMPELVALRVGLAAAWMDWLTPQDRQGFRPHVTVQNKVSPDSARALFAELQGRYAAWRGEVLGLLLWEYQGGPWSQLEELRFEGGK